MSCPAPLFFRAVMLTNRDDRKHLVERIIVRLHQALPLVQDGTRHSYRHYPIIHYWLGRFHTELVNYDRSNYHLKLAKSAGYNRLECCFYLGQGCIEQELFDWAEHYLREALHGAFQDWKQDCKNDSGSRTSLLSWARKRDQSALPASLGTVYLILYTCLLLALVFAERGRDKARAQRWLRFVGRHRDFLRRPTNAAQWDDQHRLESKRRDIEACYEDYRGWVYYLDGHPSKARNHIEAAVKLNANAEWLYHLARVCLALAATNDSPGTDWLERARECCARARIVDFRGAFTRTPH